MKRTSLREFQQSLADRLASAKRGETARALLGVESGDALWLLDLAQSGEVVPPTDIWPVPLVKPWFGGLANVRGVLYGVTDFAAFRGQAPTPRGDEARLLLVGTRDGSRAALLVERTLGLKAPTSLHAVADATASAEPWIGATLADEEGRHWRRLDLKALLQTDAFMDVAA